MDNRFLPEGLMTGKFLRSYQLFGGSTSSSRYNL